MLTIHYARVMAAVIVATGVVVIHPIAQSSAQIDEFLRDPRLHNVVSDLVRDVMPHEYEQTRGWGKTEDLVRGLYVKREGWRIKTHRTRKPVNHGTWTMYRVELIDPDEHFQVRWENVRQVPGQRLAFELQCTARVRIFGRLSEWQQGVQLVSLSAEAEADIRLTLACEVSPRLEMSRHKFGLTLDPTVHGADLQITQFRLQRISQLDGPLVRALSSSVREILEDEIARRREKLVLQINRQLAKHQDKASVSLFELAETARGWNSPNRMLESPAASAVSSHAPGGS